jgi:REP element-mobilizing transposase RayT
MRATEQLCLAFPSAWGGARKNAGRKASPGRRSAAHRARGRHSAAVPVHVTLRLRLRSLRSQFVFPTILDVLARANRRGAERFRIVHFSVQWDHLHLIVEALDRRALLEGMRGLSVSLARSVNRLLFRRGALSADRWHGHALATPRAVRHALVYVLANAKKHGHATELVDPLSSSRYFDGFHELAPRRRAEDSVFGCSRTWLLRTGWTRHRLISIHEAPRPA